MTFEWGDRIEALPPLVEPISLVACDANRDGGSVDVVLRDTHGLRLALWFDSRWGKLGRLYVRSDSTQCVNPVAQDSPAEREVVRLIRHYLEHTYTVEERQYLSALSEAQVFRLTDRRERDGYLLLRAMYQVEELLKLALCGVITRV